MTKRKCVPLGEAERAALRASLDVVEREIELVEAEWSRIRGTYGHINEIEWCIEQLDRLHKLAEPIRLDLFRTTDFLHRSVKS